MSAPGDIRAALTAFLDALTPRELRELDKIADDILNGRIRTGEGTLAQLACDEYVRRRVAGWESFPATLARVRAMAAGDPAQLRSTLPPVPPDESCDICGGPCPEPYHGG